MTRSASRGSRRPSRPLSLPRSQLGVALPLSFPRSWSLSRKNDSAVETEPIFGVPSPAKPGIPVNPCEGTPEAWRRADISVFKRAISSSYCLRIFPCSASRSNRDLLMTFTSLTWESTRRALNNATYNIQELHTCCLKFIPLCAYEVPVRRYKVEFLFDYIECICESRAAATWLAWTLSLTCSGLKTSVLIIEMHQYLCPRTTLLNV